MNDTERDRMFQTALRQIAQQRAEAALASRGIALRTQAASSRGRATRVVGGVLLAVWLQPMPAFAIKRESNYDGLRRWEHGSYCQGLFNRGHWYTDYLAYLSGC